MKKIILSLMAALALILSLPFNLAMAQTLFFESLYDVPVMPGLQENMDMSGSFDKAEGRIAYAVASTQGIDNKEILKFYSKTLPQMGWEKQGEAQYLRENEVLTLRFEKIDNQGVVRLTINPLTQ